MDLGIELLFLLLPVAALSGWLLGRRGSSENLREDCPSLSAGYFKGLNYLLDEQPDKAIEVFIQMSELDNEAVDIHFAIGNLFRRRGEVDRAIRIHQNLIARPTLSRTQRNQALFELSHDYMRAGLFDRAETLLQELVEEGDYAAAALTQLLDIFQREKDWERAIRVARRLAAYRQDDYAPLIAQFLCEQAEEALNSGRSDLAQRLLKRALSEQRGCARASLLEARLQLHNGHPKAAIKALKRVEQQEPALIGESLDMLEEAYDALGRPREMVDYLREVLHRHGSISIMLALAELLRRHEGREQALVFVREQLRERPSLRGMRELIELMLSDGEAVEELRLLDTLSAELIASKPLYRCSHCGFTAKHLHWHCPSCRQWNTVRPIQGIEGE